ncbi:MAG: response regulator, partial [Anaerolineae bacterium]|nr:response regulator [Anaerolineae bacterium]
MNRILLVEDEPELARAITRELKAEGYQVKHAADGLAALDAHSRSSPDLVIL